MYGIDWISFSESQIDKIRRTCQAIFNKAKGCLAFVQRDSSTKIQTCHSLLRKYFTRKFTPRHTINFGKN